MPVTTRSGLQTEDDKPASSSEPETHRQESEENTNGKKRRTTAECDDGQVQTEDNDTRGSSSASQRDKRPKPIRTRVRISEPEPAPVASGSEPPRTPRRRGGRYLGRVLGTGRSVVATPSPRSVRNRPPTPYARRMSLPQTGPENDGWEPSIVIGRSLGENLSRAETARRTVRQWEAVYEHVQQETPDAVGPILEQLEDARRELGEMDMTEENTTPVNDLASSLQAAVQARLRILNGALQTSECTPEATNIRAAIQAYRDGTIQPQRWTLFWNGRIVDTCDSYRAFCEDREARLDRYEREYGPGWLWYEMPLEGQGQGQPPLAMGAACLEQNPNLYDLGSWSTTLGFRRVKAYVSRDGKSTARAGSVHKRRQPGRPITSSHREVKEVEYVAEEPKTRLRKKEAAELRETKSNTYILKDDPTAPHVFFDLLLDSGATFPLIYKQDLRAMGVNAESYPAQTIVDIASVDSSFVTRLYELRVDIPSSNGSPLVDPRRPVYPNERPELGAVVPVAILPPQPPYAPPPGSPVRLRETRKVERPRLKSPGLRLSGMLPFTACYVSVAPGSKTLWLGEDRRDVLGALKLPGQRRLFSADGGQKERDLRDRAMGPPAVRFEHQLAGGGKLVDEDGELGLSEVRIWDANEEEKASFRVGPRKKAVRFEK